ncbi:MAG: hypothetical protein M3Z75_16255 [Actinomycetota bacterium]|nr:hypothetical protein [Actinomycetota bacterium]
MTGSDLIMMAPWIIFGAGLAVVCIRLLQSRRPSRTHPGRPASSHPGPAGPGNSPPEARCGRDITIPAAPRPAAGGRRATSHSDRKEARCPDKNT